MKGDLAVIEWKAGEIKFLERAGWDGRNLRPMADLRWDHSSGLAKPLIRGIMVELQGKEFEGQLIEAALLEAPGSFRFRRTGVDDFAQPFGEFYKN
jgi:hypothetical protein